MAFQQGDAYRGGIGVAIGTNSQGLNLLFRDETNHSPVRHFSLLDDGRAWSPTHMTNNWQNDTWYWLRLRQAPKMDGINTLFGKVWPADWITAEPADWQIKWADADLPAPHGPGRLDRVQQ